MDAELVETYRGGIPAWECDAFGHLNIAFYGERFADAAQDLLERHAPGQRWRTLGLDTRYERELRAGAGIVIRSGIIAADGVGLRLGHIACNSASGLRTTLVEHHLVPAPDGDAGLLARCAGARVAWHEAGFAPLALPAGAGPIATGRDRVRARESDAAGELALEGFLHRFSNACLQLLDAIGMDETSRRQARRGFATFETRLALEAVPRAGDGVAIASAILAVGTSSLRMLHRMSATRTGRPLATFYQAGVNFDLDARRSAPFAPDQRAAALALRVAGGA